jgi:hypothetical protein
MPYGVFTVDEQEMLGQTSSFYEDLYRSEGLTNLAEVINVILVKVMEEMNSALLDPFDESKVKTVLFQMFPTKAPGPDGFPVHFFQTHWDICGEEVTMAMLQVLKGEDNMEDINQTFIVLIPKVASLEELGQYRPISLCQHHP